MEGKLESLHCLPTSRNTLSKLWKPHSFVGQSSSLFQWRNIISFNHCTAKICGTQSSHQQPNALTTGKKMSRAISVRNFITEDESNIVSIGFILSWQVAKPAIEHLQLKSHATALRCVFLWECLQSQLARQLCCTFFKNLDFAEPRMWLNAQTIC